MPLLLSALSPPWKKKWKTQNSPDFSHRLKFQRPTPQGQPVSKHPNVTLKQLQNTKQAFKNRSYLAIFAKKSTNVKEASFRQFLFTRVKIGGCRTWRHHQSTQLETVGARGILTQPWRSVKCRFRVFVLVLFPRKEFDWPFSFNCLFIGCRLCAGANRWVSAKNDGGQWWDCPTLWQTNHCPLATNHTESMLMISPMHLENKIRT